MRTMLPCYTRLLTMFLLLLGTTSALWSATRLKFDKTSQYMGTLKEEEGQAKARFTFTNISKEPVLITVKSSCGCYTVDYTRAAVVPGDTGHVTVAYNPAGRPGVFNKTATVHVIDDPKPYYLRISGQVRPRPKGPRDYYPFLDGNIRLKSNHLVYGKIKDDASKTLSTIMYNNGSEKIRFSLNSTEIPAWIELRMSKEELAPGDTLKIWARYNAAAQTEYGQVFDQVYLQSDDPQRPLKVLRFSARIQERFTGTEVSRPAKMVLDKSKIDFGEPEQGEMAAVPLAIRNPGSSPLIIRRVYSACSCLEFKMSRDTIPPGESENLLVIYNTRGRLGKELKEFHIIANTPKLPERSILTEIAIKRPETE